MKCQAIIEDFENLAYYAPAQRIRAAGSKPCSRAAKYRVGKLCFCKSHAQLALDGLVDEQGEVASTAIRRDVRAHPERHKGGFFSWARGLPLVKLQLDTRKLDPEKLAKAIDWPVAEWPGNCYGVAAAIVKAGLVEGVAVYGHWLGPVHPDGYFGDRTGLPVVQHGWILSPEGEIIDPTRWVFENVQPYIYVGRNDAAYDEGGNAVREWLLSPCPAPTGERKFTLTLGPTVLRKVQKLLGDQSTSFTNEQVFWLANLPYDRLRPFAPEIYAAFKEHEHIEAYIPIDNRRRAERERRAQ